MVDLPNARQAQSSALLRTMKAKKLTLKALAAEVGLSPFIVAAALHGKCSCLGMRQHGRQKRSVWRRPRSF